MKPKRWIWSSVTWPCGVVFPPNVFKVLSCDGSKSLSPRHAGSSRKRLNALVFHIHCRLCPHSRAAGQWAVAKWRSNFCFTKGRKLPEVVSKAPRRLGPPKPGARFDSLWSEKLLAATVRAGSRSKHSRISSEATWMKLTQVDANKILI